MWVFVVFVVLLCLVVVFWRVFLKMHGCVINLEFLFDDRFHPRKFKVFLDGTDLCEFVWAMLQPDSVYSPSN